MMLNNRTFRSAAGHRRPPISRGAMLAGLLALGACSDGEEAPAAPPAIPVVQLVASRYRVSLL